MSKIKVASTSEAYENKEVEGTDEASVKVCILTFSYKWNKHL